MTAHINASDVVKMRIGDVILKRIGPVWHVYEVGPVTYHTTLAEAITQAMRLGAEKRGGKR